MSDSTTEQLSSLSSSERLDAYNLIIDGCSHLWSKNKLQTDKAMEFLKKLAPLAKNDPYFLAHLTSYAVTKLKTKDLHVFLTYMSGLSDADGTPFSIGSKYMKPNLRYISAAALHRLDPKMVLRVTQLMGLKYYVDGIFRESRHAPQAMVTAIKKYIKYRENNLDIIRGVKKSGLGEVYKNLYRAVHMRPSDEVAKILRWQQKDRKIEFETSLIDFTKLTDLQIAKKIRKEKINAMGAISSLGQANKKVTPVIAVALLEQMTGNQAVIFRKLLEDNGLLNDKEVLTLYESKIKEASTALDRVETLTKTASESVKKVMKSARAEKRKEDLKGIGKVYLHIDISGSMNEALEFAKTRGAIVAECVDSPKDNFRWGVFNGHGYELPIPGEFVQDAFRSLLYAVSSYGSTDCFALYPYARTFGADVDIFVTDQEQTDGNLEYKIRDFHRQNNLLSKPKSCVVIDFAHLGTNGAVYQAYKDNNIPVSIINPKSLTESALISQTVAKAIKGPVALVDEIMATPLLKLPEYYYAL